MDTFTLGTEKTEYFHWAIVDRTEPMWHARIEFRGLARLHDDVVFAEYQSQSAVENVEPFVTLVNARIRLGANGIDDELVCLHPTGASGERVNRHMLASNRRRAHPRILDGRRSDEFIQGNLVCPGDRKE